MESTGEGEKEGGKRRRKERKEGKGEKKERREYVKL